MKGVSEETPFSAAARKTVFSKFGFSNSKDSSTNNFCTRTLCRKMP